MIIPIIDKTLKTLTSRQDNKIIIVNRNNIDKQTCPVEIPSNRAMATHFLHFFDEATELAKNALSRAVQSKNKTGQQVSSEKKKCLKGVQHQKISRRCPSTKRTVREVSAKENPVQKKARKKSPAW